MACFRGIKTKVITETVFVFVEAANLSLLGTGQLDPAWIVRTRDLSRRSKQQRTSSQRTGGLLFPLSCHRGVGRPCVDFCSPFAMFEGRRCHGFRERSRRYVPVKATES